MWTRFSPFINTAKQFVGAPMPGSNLLCPPAETKAGQWAQCRGPGAPGSVPRLPPSPRKQWAGWCRSIPCRPALGNNCHGPGINPPSSPWLQKHWAWPGLMPIMGVLATHCPWVHLVKPLVCFPLKMLGSHPFAYHWDTSPCWCWWWSKQRQHFGCEKLCIPLPTFRAVFSHTEYFKFRTSNISINKLLCIMSN